MSFPLTEEQEAIREAVAKGQKSLMIGALAGTGKTSTIEASAPGVKEPALATAFNKKNATELQGRLPGNFHSKTQNGIGHGAWIRANPNASFQAPDNNKLLKILSSLSREDNVYLTAEQREDIRNTVTAAMLAGISPGDQGRPFIPDTDENWLRVADCSPAEAPFVVDMSKRVLEASVNCARTGYISFDDQIYCPVILGGRFAQYPRVFVDEGQDLNILNHKLVALSLREGGLLGVVGDKLQAIYAFRGADVDSMEKMRLLRDDWEDLALTLTFRCPKAVVARQQAHAPGYRAYEGNHDGRVLIPPIMDYDEGVRAWSWDWIKDQLAEIPPDLMSPKGPNCAIICRNNAPLISLAFKLIRAGVGCQMAGSDIGRGLIGFTNRIKGAKDDNMPITKFALAMSEYVEHECSLAEVNGKPERAERLRDQQACIVATMEGSQPKTTGELRNNLKYLFDRGNMPIILTSGHRAKGMEWPLVVHLDPWRIPSKWAQMALIQGDPKPMEQENNLHYVIETRTKHTLVNADLETFY